MALYLISNNATEDAKSQQVPSVIKIIGMAGQGVFMITFTTYCYVFNGMTEESYSEGKDENS